MNYALLSKCRIIDDNSEMSEAITRIKSYATKLDVKGRYETVIYLSSTDDRVLFVLSLWFTLEDLEAVREKLQLMTASSLEINLEDQLVFRLIQEYRKMDAKIGASFIRLVTFPEPIDTDKYIQAVAAIKDKRTEIPGYVGGWAGYNLDKPCLLLSRADWTSLQHQEQFFISQSTQNFRNWYLSQGAQTDFASYQLEAIVQAPSLK